MQRPISACVGLAFLGVVAVVSSSGCSGDAPPSAPLAPQPGDLDAGREEPTDAGPEASSDAAPPSGSGCIADNTPAALAKRDGFVQVCADPASNPDARCGDGSPYRFSYRPATGASQGLLVYFKGGGNCTDYVSCWGKDGRGGEGRRVGTMENTKRTEPYVLPPEAGARTFGFFDRVEAASPFREFDVVYVSYCTGDAGIGAPRVVDLARPPGADPAAPPTIRTYFHGEHNVALAIGFAKKQFPSPKRLAIVGSSAGAYASLKAVPALADAYASPSIPIAYYGEGGLGVGRAQFIDEGNDIVASHNGASGKPLVRFTQFTHISDATQVDYAPPPYDNASAFQTAARSLLEERAAKNPSNYRFFAAEGTCHTVAQTPALYMQFEEVSGKLVPKQPVVKPNPDLTIQGQNLVAWLGSLVTGSGLFDASFLSRAGDWSKIATACKLPLSGQD